MRPALAVAIGAVLLAATLIVAAPASLLDTRIAALSQGRMRLANATGTVWNGSGDLVLLPALSRQPLRWRLDVLPLLHGEIRGTIGGERDGALSTTLAYGRDRIELRTLDLSLPVESVARLASATKNGPALGGNLRLQIDHWVWLGDALDAQLILQWRDASVGGPRADAPIGLGEVQVDLNGRGAEVSGPVRNAGGEVEITGQLTLAAAGAARLDLTVRPRTTDRERADMITAALSMLGAADGNGGYRVRWTGAWR